MTQEQRPIAVMVRQAVWRDLGRDSFRSRTNGQGGPPGPPYPCHRDEIPCRLVRGAEPTPAMPAAALRVRIAAIAIANAAALAALADLRATVAIVVAEVSLVATFTLAALAGAGAAALVALARLPVPCTLALALLALLGAALLLFAAFGVVAFAVGRLRQAQSGLQQSQHGCGAGHPLNRRAAIRRHGNTTCPVIEPTVVHRPLLATPTSLDCGRRKHASILRGALHEMDNLSR